MILYILCFVTQSCPTLYNSMDYSPPGSSVHGDSPGKNTGIGSYSSRPCPPPGDLPDPGIEPGSPALQANSLPAELPMKLHIYIYVYICKLITKIRSDNTAITSHRYNYVVKTLKKILAQTSFKYTVQYCEHFSFPLYVCSSGPCRVSRMKSGRSIVRPFGTAPLWPLPSSRWLRSTGCR